jgi:hypothetical protein
MSKAGKIWMALFVAAVVTAAYLARISVSPSANPGIVYVTDRWTGSVSYCTVGTAGFCRRIYSAENSN